MSDPNRSAWVRPMLAGLAFVPGAIALGQGCGTSSTTTPFPGSGTSAGANATSGSSGASNQSSGAGAGTSGSSGGSSNGATSGSGSTGSALSTGSTSNATSITTTATDGGITGSAGCGATTLPMPVSVPDAGPYGGGSLPLQLFTINVGGTTREYILGLPANYNANQKYPVVFAWHGRGGTDLQVAWGGTSSYDVFGGFYGQRYLSTQNGKPMIFVSGQGLDPNDAGAGWPNTNGQDVAFTQAMVAWLEANYCVDTSHIYSVGMSYGGIMSNTLGCAMGDVFRAITPMSGLGPGGFGGTTTCKGQVAAWLAHGTQDTTIPIEAGMASRDYWVKANHCGATTAATSPSPCVAYQGCDPGHPVDWCEFDGGHTVVSFEPQGIWTFLGQF